MCDSVPVNDAPDELVRSGPQRLIHPESMDETRSAAVQAQMRFSLPRLRQGLTGTFAAGEAAETLAKRQYGGGHSGSLGAG